MKAPAHYFQLRQECRPLMTDYLPDLLRIDRRFIRRWPDVPFLHVTRSWGTHLYLLFAADSPVFPPEGEKARYLFGEADCWHILKDYRKCLDYHVSNHPSATVHYFDGRTLRVITYEEGQRIAHEYCDQVTAAWAKARDDRHRQREHYRDLLRVDAARLAAFSA